MIFDWSLYRQLTKWLLDIIMGWGNYPDHWNRLRVKVLNRDGHECTNCGVSAQEETLHVHHKTPISDGGSHSLSNLITLCHPCHEAEHNHPIPTPDGRKEGKKIAVPPCPSGGRAYKCARCKRYVSIDNNRYLRCIYCGHKILLKTKPSGIREINVE